MEIKEPVLIEVSEHRRHREEVLLGDRVVLVVVALGAVQRQAQERVACGGHSVGDAVLTELLGDRAALEGHAMDAAEGGGDAGRLRGVRQQVACDLFRDEPVVGHVVQDGVQHPVPPGPGEHRLVARIAPGVGVTRQVEPGDGLMLGRARGGEERVDPPPVGVR